MPLKRLGNLKEDEGNKRIPRSGFEGRNRLVCAGIQDSTIGCKSSGRTPLHLSHISQKCFSVTCVWKGIPIPLIHISIIKKYVIFLLEGWIAKFLFLCLNCLWNVGFARGVAVPCGSTAVQLCVPALVTTSGPQGMRSARGWSAAEVGRRSAGVSWEEETLGSDSAL